MNKEHRIREMNEMYRELTDPLIQKEKRRELENKKRMQEIKEDTGIYE